MTTNYLSMKHVLFALLAGLGGCAGPGEGPEIWRFAIEESRGSVQDAYAGRFEALIEERTGGAVDVITYPYGTLGTSDQVTELLYSGSLQLAMASPGHLGKLLPEVQVFLLHYTLPGEPEADLAALSDPALLAHFDGIYARKGFQLLSFYTEGEMVWTTREPVRSPADFEGVKMRTMTSPLLLAAYEAYGASPTPLPYAEVYSGLQLNMIDGQVNPVFAIEEMSFYEVTDWMIFPGHARFVTSAVANRGFYQGLSEERRALVDEVIDELGPWIAGLERRYNEERLEAILERRPEIGVLRLSGEERAAFRAAAAPVRAQYLALAGPGGQAALDALLAAVDRAEGR